MAAKIKVFVCGPSVLYDDEGHPLSPTKEYSVQDSYRIQDYIENGFLVEVVEEAPAQNTSEPKTQQKSKARVSDTEQENSNG